MKKKSYAARLGGLALALTLATACLTGGTMARYVSEVTGDATAAVAAWSFKVNESDSTFTTIDLGDTTHRTNYNEATIKKGVIAPGTTGHFDIVIDGTGSEVGIEYSVAFGAASGSVMPDDLLFSTTDNSADSGGDKIANFQIADGSIPYAPSTDGKSPMKKTITVYWNWNIGEGDTPQSNDNTYQDKDWKLDIKVTGKQAKPTTASTL